MMGFCIWWMIGGQMTDNAEKIDYGKEHKDCGW